MSTLQEAFTSLSQRVSSHKTFGIHSLLSLRLIIILLSHDRVTIKCGCVLPSAISRVHPVSCLPLLSTALSRNLTGFHSLSSLQGTIHTGYLSMDKSRKLVPILSSDEHAHSLPLVGIWVSGANIDHPVIWSTILHYINTSAPLDRVFGEGCGFLILLPGKENQLWECVAKDDGGRKWAWHIGESSMESLCCELMPVIESTAAFTLFDTTQLQWEKQHGYHDESLPLLSPAPRPVSVPNMISHDTDLSCLSEVNTTQDYSHVSETKHELIQEQQKQLVTLQEQVKNLLSDRILVKEATVQTIPTVNAATNTGQSLLESNYSLATPNHDQSTLNSVISSKRSLSPPLSPPTMSSIMSTTLLSNPIIDIHSPEYSYCSSDSYMDEDAPVDHKVIYQQLKNQVEELLGSTSCEGTRDSSTTNSVLSSEKRQPISSSQTSFNSPNLSVLHIPRIQCDETETSSVDVTFDTQANMAEIITQRYLSPENSVAMTTQESTVMDYSMNTHHYLSKHGLTNRENILDIKKLKSLPKLL